MNKKRNRVKGTVHFRVLRQDNRVTRANQLLVLLTNKWINERIEIYKVSNVNFIKITQLEDGDEEKKELNI